MDQHVRKPCDIYLGRYQLTFAKQGVLVESENTIEGFHVTSLQQNLPSHAAHSGHVGYHKIWPNSLLLKLHKALLHHRNNNVSTFTYCKFDLLK